MLECKIILFLSFIVSGSALERFLQRVQHLLPQTDRAAGRLDHQHRNAAAPGAERIGEQLVPQHRRFPGRSAVLRHSLPIAAHERLLRVTDIADAELPAVALDPGGTSVV